eukprot:gene6222-6938_t
MPVLKRFTSTMNCMKSAELIQELKAEAEKIIINSQNPSRNASSSSNNIANLETQYSSYEPKPNHVSTHRRNVIPYPDHNYGQQPPLTPPGWISPDPNEQTDTGNEDEDEEGVTRCICGFSHDDGYMICCDRCGTWQHIECMGIKSDSVPDNYLCDRCEPRTLDVERARAIQRRKKERHSDDDGDDDTDTDEEVQRSTSYTAVSNTPTRITLTANANGKAGKGKSRLKNTSVDAQGKGRKAVNRKRQRKYSRPGNEGVSQNDSNSMDTFVCNDNFQFIDNCIYDEPLANLKLQNSDGLVAIEDIIVEQPIIEYKGKVSFLSTFEERSPFFKRACPFVLYYNKIDKLELVIDARFTGNEARYLQRSCEPNAETRHFVADGKICVAVVCTKAIPKGSHITIPFEYPLETYMGYINCACCQPTCLAVQYNQKFLSHSARKRPRFSTVESSTRNSASENQGDTDTDDNEVDVGTGERPVSRRKTLSREERKLQAYVKQIEKMEKKEKKTPKTGPHRPMQLVDPTHSHAICPVTNRFVPTNGVSCQIVVPQSPMSTVVARRISTNTPGTTRKRLSVNKNTSSQYYYDSTSVLKIKFVDQKCHVARRPRVSSGSSDPLSPDLLTVASVTTACVTPMHDTIHPFALEQNGIFRQKAKKDKDHLSLSMSFEKPAALREMTTRKLRRDYSETKAGSPTPPTTPGQLSPASRTYAADQSLSIDVTSSVTSPAGSLHAAPDRRNVLNGLLQIAEQSDNDSTCSSSPLAGYVTSNGMSTAEEIMGDIMTRDSTVRAPVGKLISRRASRDCGYYGSLKKRWLVQFNDSKTFRKPRFVNGSVPLSLSSLINDCSIKKRAGHIASYTFNALQNSLPLKKRRLRAALMADRQATIVNAEVNATHSQEAAENKEAVRSKEADCYRVQAGDDSETIVSDVKVSEEQMVEGGVLKQNPDMIVDETVSLMKGVTSSEEKKEELEIAEVEISAKDDNAIFLKSVGDNICGDGIDKSEIVNSTQKDVELKDSGKSLIDSSNVTSINVPNRGLVENNEEKGQIESNGYETGLNMVQSLPYVKDVTSSKLESRNDVSASQDVASDVKTGVITGLKSEIADVEEKLEPAVVQLQNAVQCSLERMSDSTALEMDADSNRDSNNDSFLHRQLKGQNESQLNSNNDSSSVIDVNSGSLQAVVKPERNIFSVDYIHTNATITDSPVVNVQSVPMGIEPEKLSAFIRDPRLSSSSSRSSRDSLDNVFMRSDSVSSVDDTTPPFGQRLDAEKRSLSGSIERLDATPVGKKKVSLREYRNRKRANPPPRNHHHPQQQQHNSVKSTELSVNAKTQQESPVVLLTDTDSLLLPRTLTLSTGFASQTGKEGAVPVLPSAKATMPSAGTAKHPASSIVHPATDMHPVSSTMYPASSTMHPASSTMHPVSSTMHPASSTMHPASLTMHPASSIMHPTEIHVSASSTAVYPSSASGIHSSLGSSHPHRHSAMGMYPTASAMYPVAASTVVAYPSSSIGMPSTGMRPGLSEIPLASMRAVASVVPHNAAVVVPDVSAVKRETNHASSMVSQDVQQQHPASGPMFEPVSPHDDHSNESTSMDKGKQAPTTSGQAFSNYRNSTNNSVRHSGPESFSDAMDIDDEEPSSVGMIQIGMPHVDAKKHFLQHGSPSNCERQGNKVVYPMPQMRDLQQQQQHNTVDSRTPNNKPLQQGFSGQQFPS